ncbi:hypothetical protein A3Q56_02705 [Intoshia linei]|uniref:EGF-like domain-containing protein n=1 Tax=Intoshia linei TaxID=1819745 RepID=A0A177B7K3_9BILA|nr:hypothetical protein A3Q56_02705 [Intoshia linei]
MHKNIFIFGFILCLYNGSNGESLSYALTGIVSGIMGSESQNCSENQYKWYTKMDFMEWFSVCSHCHATCQSCNEKYAINCLSCKDTEFLNIDGGCEGCHQNCLTCQNQTYTDCTSCTSPQFLNTGKCTLCPEENSLVITDKSTRLGICYVCHETCNKCIGIEETSCINCQYDRYILNGTCIECQTNQYLIYTNETASIGECYDCDTSCKTCNFKSYSCTSCLDNEYLTDLSECKDCDILCKTCIEESDHCTSCVDDKVLLEDFTCGVCKLNEYYTIINTNLTTGKCKNCTENQFLVLSTNNATSQGPRGACVSCTDNEFLTISNSTTSAGNCSLCNTSCKSCAVKANKCTSCNESTYLNTITDQCESCNLTLTLYDTNTRAGYCAECRRNQLKITLPNASFDCRDCNSTCAECEVNYQTCKTCISGRYFVPTTKECYACNKPCKECSTAPDLCTVCLDGYYKTNPPVTSNICEKCDPSCKTCMNQKPNSCTSCDVDFFLTTEKICAQCDKSICYSCNGITCLHCYKEFYLKNSTCTDCSEIQNCTKCNGLFCTKCTDGFTLVNETTCEVCEIANCKNCYENKLTKCSICLNGFVKDGSTCKSIEEVEGCISTNGVLCTNCREGYKFIPKGCEKCVIENCSNCKDNRETCLLCKSGFYLDGEICKENCTDNSCQDNNLQDGDNLNLRPINTLVQCVEIFSFDKNLISANNPIYN